MTLRRSRAAALAAALVLVLAAACSSDSSGSEAATTSTTTEAAGSSSTTEAEGDGATPVELASGDDLYEVPDPLPDVPHGTLLHHREITPSPTEGARAFGVMYTSESVQGEPIAVTGQVLIPTAEAPEGGRPTLALAHGTTGLADECAPSKGEGALELRLMAPVVDEGWIVTVTDYEGLGTPGRHPYLVGESEGRGVIDSALAASALPGADQGDQLAIAGYSQGGHGALWAGEIAPEWAPELDVVGTFAGAPATEIDLILRAAPRLPQAGFAYMTIAGIAAAYPEADPSLILTDEGVTRLDAVDEGCTRDIFAAVAGIPASDLVRADGPASEPWATLAKEQNPGQVTTEAPILIIHSAQDDVVPVALSGVLYARMCQEGQVVERRVLEDGGGHTAAAPEAYAQGLRWLLDQADGAEPVDGCATS